MDFIEKQKLNSKFILIAFMVGVLVAIMGFAITVKQMQDSGESIYSIIWVPAVLMVVFSIFLSSGISFRNGNFRGKGRFNF